MAAKLLRHCRSLTRICSNTGFISCPQNLPVLTLKRGLKNSRKLYPYLRKLHLKQLEAGPEAERHPSERGCWNYDAELFAFGKRYGEEFNESILKKAFNTSEYIEAEEQNRKKLGIDVSVLQMNIEDNTLLAKKGEQIASQYIKAFLRHTYPMMLEEGIQAIHNFLMSDETIFHIASNFGITDLIMSPKYPPEDTMYITTFKAIIGAVAESQNKDRAELFVRDFIITQLAGQNIMELWDVVNPMGLLSSILATQGRGPPEPRLLWQSAGNTMMSVYHVGIYSDKKLIGKSPGETVTIAEEMAARDALSRFMNVPVSVKPIQYSNKTANLKLDYNRKNQSVNDLLTMSQDVHIKEKSVS